MCRGAGAGGMPGLCYSRAATAAMACPPPALARTPHLVPCGIPGTCTHTHSTKCTSPSHRTRAELHMGSRLHTSITPASLHTNTAMFPHGPLKEFPVFPMIHLSDAQSPPPHATGIIIIIRCLPLGTAAASSLPAANAPQLPHAHSHTLTARAPVVVCLIARVPDVPFPERENVVPPRSGCHTTAP